MREVSLIATRFDHKTAELVIMQVNLEGNHWIIGLTDCISIDDLGQVDDAIISPNHYQVILVDIET